MGKVKLDLSGYLSQDSSSVQTTPSSSPSPTALDLSGYGITTQKKNDTESSGEVSSSAGPSKPNPGVDTGNLFTKFFRGLNHGSDAAFAGVYDVASSLLADTAFGLDVINPRNWFSDIKIAAATVGSDLQSTGRKISDMLALDHDEIMKQSKMSWKEKQDYLQKRYDKSIDKAEDFGFKTGTTASVKDIYDAGLYLQGIGNLSFNQALEDSGINKEDIAKGKGVVDFISEGKYADAAALASLSAARTIPMSIALAASGGTAEVFAGSALMGTGSEINRAYEGDEKLSGSEIVKSIWSGLIEGTTESIFQTNLKELRRTGQALIGGSPIVEAVAEGGADAVKKQLVRGMLPAVKRIFRGAGEEGLEEILSTVGNFIVDKAQSSDQKVTLDELQDLAKKSADAFIIGSLSGGSMSGALVMATSNKLDEVQKKSIKRLQEVANDETLSDETRKIASDKIQDIMKYQERGAYDDYTQIAAIEDVQKRSQAIDALNKIEALQQDKKNAKDEAVQAGIDEKIQEKVDIVNGLMLEQQEKEIDRHPEALKARMADAKIKAKDFLENNNAYSVFQQDHANTMRAVELGKDVEVEDLNKATDQLHEVEQVIHNSEELTPLEKDAALDKINGQIRNLETYINATENGTRLSESQAEGRIASTSQRAVERAKRVRNNRFKDEIFTAFDEKGNPFQVTAQVNEKGQISLKPKPKYRVNVETKQSVEVDNSIKIKGDLEVIDKKENEDNDITEIRVRDNKTGKEFTTNSPVLIPMLMANQAKREGKYAPDRAYVVDENIQIAEANPILNKLTKEQRARINANNKALKEINPNARIIIFDNAIEIQRALMEKGYSRKEAASKSSTSNALKVGDDIFVNRMSMQDNTIPHEIFHHAFSEIAKEFPEEFIKMQKRIMMVLPDKVSARLQQFADLYAENAKNATDEEKIEMAEEFMMELGAMMTVRDAQIQRGWVHKAMLAIREMLSKYAGKLKLNGLANLINNNVFSESAKIEDLAKFFESLSESIRKGNKADLTYLENQIEQNRMMAARQAEVTPEQEQEDIDSLNEDFAGELYEPTNLNITGTINQDVPESKRKPKKPKEDAKEQKRGDFTLMPHPIIDKSILVGKKYSVTMSDHTKVGEYRNEKTGVHIKNLMGGVFYPYIQGVRDAGIAWASVTAKAARDMVLNAQNQDYTLVYRMARSTGSRGNANFNEIALAELIAPVVNGKITEEEFLKQLNNKLNSVSGGKQLGAGKSFLSKYGKDSGQTITINKTEVIKAENKKGEIVNKTVPVLDKDGKNIRIKVPRLEITSIEGLKKGLEKESFSKRGGFWSTVLKDSYNKKSTGPWYKFLESNEVTSIEDIVHGLAEAETDEANDHDIVAAIKIAEPEYTEDGKVKIYTTRKSLVDEKKGIFFSEAPDHPSYPYVVKGEPVGVLNEFNSVTDYFPVINDWIKSERLNSPYKAVETMGKELVSSREKIKAQKQMTPVFHGGEVADITTLEDDKIFFVANDKEEALAYARDNDGNLIEINIDKSKIAPESEIRKILEDEFGLPYEYMIHELIDPRFEDSYIGDELVSELFNRLEEEGYEGGEFMDSAVTGKSRNTQNMFIINPANTLSNNDYLNITLATQSEAEELLEEGYRPLLPNGEVMELATNEDIEKLFSKVTNLINDSKLQMVKPSEYTKYTQAKEASKETTKTEPLKQQKNNPAYNVLSKQIESQERRTGPSLIKAAKGIMNKDLTEFRNFTQATYRSLYKMSFDRMVNIRKEMEDSAFNRSMFLMFNKAGASQFGNYKFEKAFKRIFANLTEDDFKLLDTVIFLRRVVEVDTNFDNQRIELENKLAAINQIIANNPSVKEDYADEIRKLKQEIKEKARPDHGKEGAITWAGKDIKANKETALDTLDKMKNELGDEKYNDIVSRSDEYFKEFSEILNYKMKNGIITKETYEMFKNYNYSPRKFLDYAFGIEARDKDGKPIGDVLLNSNQFFFRGSILSSEDIKNIKQGSETDFMMTDSRKLLQGAMIMAEVKVATNKMVKALAEDSQLTNQGWVKPMKYQTFNDGTIKTNPDGSYKYYEAEDGYRKMDYWMDGKKYSYQLREDLAREFLDEELRDLRGEEGSLRRGIYDWTTKLSGSQLVRFFATGINTGFFISNIPIDVASQVNVTDIYAGGVAGQYKQAMGGTLELSKRLLKMEMGFEDPYVERLLQEYAESGGLMMSQTQEAMGKNIRSKLVEYLALFGNISEIASKLNSYRTVKNRLMDQYYDKNKQNPVGDDMVAIREEAAYKARAAMDYHRGGLVSKMWDGYVPYFNVFTQGSFISWKYIKNNKVDFFNKIYKAGIALAGLTVYNMMVAGDDYDNDDVQMDLLNKIVIFMPWRNEDGKRAYIKISVPSIVKGWLNTFQHIGEGSYYKLVSDEPSRQAKWRAGVTDRWLKGFTPSANSFVSVPVAKALMEYNFNYDLYRERPIFNEGSKPVSTGREGIDSEKVLEFYKIIGLATGFSPIKTQKAIEDIIPALNPIVQMGYAVTDKIIDSHNGMLNEGSKYKLEEYQRSKFGKGDVGDMATSFFKGIKDRAVDYTDPKVKFPKNKEAFLAADEARGDVYQDLKAEVKMMSDKNVTPQQLGDKLKDKPFMEQKYAIDYYFMLKKRNDLNFKDNFNEYSQFMFSADAKAKAEKLYQSSPLTNYLNPQNETEKKYMEDLIMLKVLDPATTLEYQNYFNNPKK